MSFALHAAAAGEAVGDGLLIQPENVEAECARVADDLVGRGPASDAYCDAFGVD